MTGIDISEMLPNLDEKITNKREMEYRKIKKSPKNRTLNFIVS